MVQVPAVYSENREKMDYAIDHYWDAYFAPAQNGSADVCIRTDTALVLGVPKGDVEGALANFITLLDMKCADASWDNLEPMKRAQKGVRKLFEQIEKTQKADSTLHAWPVLTEMAARYLYDPNSPLRNEDYWLPFVCGLAESECTRPDMRNAYRFEANMCAMNRFGSVAPDFSFKTLQGRKYTLHSIKADYTMLFFSNPGCTSCKQIIDDVRSRSYIDFFIATGRLAIVNVYIDEELDKWREYAPIYPSNWLNGYDWRFTIRSDEQYNVRAIPSLYLLDSGKHVLMKDAPTERVLAFLDNIEKNINLNGND